MMERRLNHSPKMRGIWQPSQDPASPTCTSASEQLAMQLAWIDKRISRSKQHAATSNRARGAVREWTQKREALLLAAAKRGIGPAQSE